MHDDVLVVGTASPTEETVVLDSRPVQAPGIRVLEREGGAKLEVDRTGDAFAINLVGRRIWELCDGSMTVRDIVQVIFEEFEVDEATARRDVQGFVEQLSELQLVFLKRGGKAG